MKHSGEMISNLSGEMQYYSFMPSKLPPNIEISSELLSKLIKANRELVKLDIASNYIQSSDLFIAMYLRKEALLSSQIEGTQCTLDDILDPEIEENTNLDVADVINYLSASIYAINLSKELPLCNRFLKEIHKELMKGIRGSEKNPGEFRRSQNWIGPSNCTIKDAKYIPPNVDDMNQAMYELEAYINEDDDYDPLIRAALIHYQFETIHPFLDGNGRIGRLLILLYLMQQGIIEKPCIYISYFLKKNQSEYYDRITRVRETGDYEQWISFFLDAVLDAVDDSFKSIIKLNDLHEINISKIPDSKRKRNNILLIFEYIEDHPIINIKNTARDLSMTYNTASVAINKLVDLDILEETTNAKRNRIFIYKDYLNILRKGT